jgi:hypothetical protein
MHQGFADDVIIVQDQGGIKGQLRQVVDQQGDGRLPGWTGRGIQNWRHGCSDAWLQTLQSGRHIGPEPHRVIIAAVQGQPGCGKTPLCDPFRHGSGLAEAGGSGDQGESALPQFIQSGADPRAVHQQAGQSTRRQQLGLEQGYLVGKIV